MERIEAGALVAIVPLRSQPETVLLQNDLDVRRAGGRVVLGVGGILRSEVLAWRPAGGAQDLLAEGVGVAGPVVVVGVCLYKLPPVLLSAIGYTRLWGKQTDLFGAARPILNSAVWLSRRL